MHDDDDMAEMGVFDLLDAIERASAALSRVSHRYTAARLRN